MANEAIVHVESDIDELSDQMNEMTRRMLRIEEERQVCNYFFNFKVCIDTFETQLENTFKIALEFFLNFQVFVCETF